MKYYKLKYVTARYGEFAPKMYGVLMLKSDRGWVVEVWPCDTDGDQVSDPVEWADELGWFDAIKLFYKWYAEFDRFVNYHR